MWPFYLSHYTICLPLIHPQCWLAPAELSQRMCASTADCAGPATESMAPYGKFATALCSKYVIGFHVRQQSCKITSPQRRLPVVSLHELLLQYRLQEMWSIQRVMQKAALL